MDCVHARLLLLFARPGATELVAEDSASLHEHLEQCADCQSAAHKEQQVDDAVGLAMRKVPLARDLEQRILSQLSVERRPRPWTVLATAAALLLMVGFGAGYYLQPAPKLNPEAVIGPRPGSSPEVVAAWFKERGLTMAAPAEFDFSDLDSCEVVSLQGRRVPKLLFVRPGAAAHVYVVSTADFRYDDTLAESLRGNSLQATVQPHPTASDVFFIVVFSGPADAFARRGI